jgi:hypothetical protein
MSRTKIITLEDVHKLTDNGKMVFEREVGSFTTHKNVSSPLRTGDSNPSFRIYQNNSSIWSFKDYGGGQESGSYINLIMTLYNLSFQQAIDKVWCDFNGNSKDLSRVKFEKKEKKIKSQPLLFEFNDCKFTDRHHKYWNKGGLTEDFLNKEGDIYGIRLWAINKKIQKFTRDEIAFAYVYKDENGNETGELKILRIGPEVEKQDKWKNNLKSNSLWYLYKYINQDISQLFISKSNKDALCTMKLGIPSIATQSENDKILKTNIPRLLEITPNLVLNFGSDEQGVNSSKSVSQEFNLNWFNTPKTVLDFDINDNFAYISQFGENSFINLLKKKGYL